MRGALAVAGALLATVLLPAGCATTRRNADAAFERRAYVEAAELYDRALLEDPADAKARGGRGRARLAALDEVLEAARAERQQGHPANARAELARFFRLRKRWLMSTPPSLTAALEREAAAAGTEIGDKLHPLLAAKAALRAEALLAGESGVADEPELQAVRKRARAEVQEVGVARCHELRAGVDPAATPYWAWLVARYCSHFTHEPEPAPAALPFQLSGIDVDGAVTGAPSAAAAPAAAALNQRLATALRGTPWQGPASQPRAAAVLRAHYRATYRHLPVEMEAPWMERVRYTAVESRRVPHQVSYLDTEYYSVQVPYTDYQTETYSCGSGSSYRTCTRSRSVTRYRTDHRVRTVTRYRTEYRTVTDLVTRYRNVPRVFRYTADRHEGWFELGGTLSVELMPGESAVVVPLDDRETVEAISHEASFAAANVEPVQARPPTPNEWLGARVAQIASRVQRGLDDAWATRFCRQDRYTIDEAARCLYSRRAVAEATEALRATVGLEAETITELAVQRQ